MRVQVVAVVLGMAMPLMALSQSKQIPPEQLAVSSDIVIVGTVGNRTAEWNQDHSRIQTRVRISVDQTLKGTSVPGAIEVVVPGGEVDGVGEWYSHTSRFDKEEQVVVFAKKAGHGGYGIVGGESGKLSLIRDSATGKAVVPNVGSLEYISSRIREAVRHDQAPAGH